jgi:RIO-like serine/threonine protein kinase
MRIKRKNPKIDIIEILENLEPFEDNIEINYIGAGGYGETYTFKIKTNKVLSNGEILKSGLYLIKRFVNKSTKEEISGLIKLSKYGLIPKIYFINKNYCIMKYIESETLDSLIRKHKLYLSEIKPIFERIRFLIQKWHDRGFYHGDLDNFTNILITKDRKVYLIDPVAFEEQADDLYELDYKEKSLIRSLSNL